MRTSVFACACVALLLAALPVASSEENEDSDAGGNPCVRTYLAGSADGTYVFTTAPSSASALGAGLATNVVGSGIAFFVVVQPSNCTGTTLGPPDDDPDRTSAGPQKDCPNIVLP